MATPLQYPLVNGYRQSFVSTEVRFVNPSIAGSAGGQALSLALRGYKSIKYDRKRERGELRGNSPDPLAKTRGENKYTCEADYALAEYNVIQSALQQISSGYGDVFFSIQVTHAEPGLEAVVDTILGCTLDSTENDSAAGPDPTMRKIAFSPLKVLFNGVDDLQVPLQGSQT